MEDKPTPQTPIEVTYKEPTDAPIIGTTPLEVIYGKFPMVTTTPTWVPRSFQESFAVDTATSVLYFYDFLNNAWRSSGSSFLSGHATMVGGVVDVTDPRITSSSICVASRSGGSGSAGSFPQLATGYLSGTTMRIFEGSFSLTWDVDYIIYF